MKKVYIETLGCQMNKCETERMFGILSYLGFDKTDEPKDADLLMINTCSIRQLSENKAFSYLGVWGKWKKSKPALKIAICGCAAQNNKDFITQKLPYVDMAFGPNNIYELPKYIELIYKDERVIAINEEIHKVDETKYEIVRAKSINAWIPIMNGCNNFCTYCIVPYTRGRERSRDFDEILRETKNVLAQGYKEITLLGQNVDSYGKEFKDENKTLAHLLRAINALDGEFRIRFVTSYPTDITDDLIDAAKECDKVCEYFHIPMQSGNSEVLKLMNRRYNREQYKQIVEKIRQNIPDVTITSDFIAGFPGETEEQFADTLTAIDEFELDYSNTAAYSPREKTVAARWTDRFIDEKTKKERLARLNEKNREACLKSNQKFLGRNLEILVEEKSEKDGNPVITGRTRNNKIVHCASSENLVGRFINVKIIEAKTWYLVGEII